MGRLNFFIKSFLITEKRIPPVVIPKIYTKSTSMETGTSTFQLNTLKE